MLSIQDLQTAYPGLSRTAVLLWFTLRHDDKKEVPAQLEPEVTELRIAGLVETVVRSSSISGMVVRLNPRAKAEDLKNLKPYTAPKFKEGEGGDCPGCLFCSVREGIENDDPAKYVAAMQQLTLLVGELMGFVQALEESNRLTPDEIEHLGHLHNVVMGRAVLAITSQDIAKFLGGAN